MKHLSEIELSAHLDRALTGAERSRVDDHLRTCAVCQLAIEALQAQDKALAPHLAHDPGASHFDELASRIDQRIRTQGVKPVPAERGATSGLWQWLRTPVGVSWAGAGAVAVVGVLAVTFTVFQITKQRPGDTLAARTTSPVPMAAARVDSSGLSLALAAPPSSLLAVEEPPAEAAVPVTDGDALAVRENARADERADAQHVVEMKRGANGEDQPVAAERKLKLPAPVTESAPSATEKGVVVGDRHRRAEAAGGETRQAPATGDQNASRDKVAAHAPPMTSKTQAPPTSATALSALSRESGASQMEAQRAMTQRCGTVRDAAGHPIASAMLMAVETGVSVQSGADGSFCMDLASGARTIVVMAVGYQALRLSLDGASGGPLALTLQPVAVVGGSLAGPTSAPGAASGGASRWLNKKPSDASAPQPTGSAKFGIAGNAGIAYDATDPFGSLADSSLKKLVVRARNLENGAALTKNPGGYDLAAVQWQRVLRGTENGPLESETRFHVAWARYQAWQSAPTHDRSVSAIEAISSYVLRAPPGPRMDQATRWLGQLRWSETKETSR